MHTTTPGALWPSGVATAAGYLAAGSILYLAGVNGTDLLPTLPGTPGWAWLGVLVLGCIGLLFRRSNVPLMLALTGTAVVAGALLGAGIITYLLLFEVFYAGILFGTPRLSRTVQRFAVTSVVVLPLAVGLTYRGWPFLLFGLFQALFVCLVPVWWARSIRREADRAETERRRAETERLRAERTAELAELNQRMAVAAERSAMARDLHDAIAGHLSAVALQSAAALAAADPGLDRRVLAQVRAESVQALGEMRSMIGLLESSPASGEKEPAAAGGLGQLEALAASARLSGNPVDLKMPAGLEVPVLVGSTAYRIVQESLTNAVRHAPGAATSVLVRMDGDALELNIRNALPGPGTARDRNGAPGADAAGNGTPDAAGNGTPASSGSVGSGAGLRNMLLRTAQLGGSFRAGRVAGPGTGAGWLVTAVLPVRTAADTGLPSVPHPQEAH